MGTIGFNEQGYPLMPHPTISAWERWGQSVLTRYTDGNTKAQQGMFQRAHGAQALRVLMPVWVWPHFQPPGGPVYRSPASQGEPL